MNEDEKIMVSAGLFWIYFGSAPALGYFIGHKIAPTNPAAKLIGATIGLLIGFTFSRRVSDSIKKSLKIEIKDNRGDYTPHEKLKDFQ